MNTKKRAGAPLTARYKEPVGMSSRSSALHAKIYVAANPVSG
jgi:hypothetical protein